MAAPSSAPPRFAASLCRPVGLGLAGGLVAGLGSLFLPDQFRSDLRILANLGLAGVTGDPRAGVWAPGPARERPGPGMEPPTLVYVDILRSRRMGEALLGARYRYTLPGGRLGKPRPSEGTLLQYLGASSVDRGMGALRGLLAIQRDVNSGTLTLSAQTRSPELSQQVARKAAGLLQEILLDLARTAGDAKARLTLDRLEEARGRCAQLETRFQGFQAGNRNWDVSPDPTIRFRGYQIKEELDLWRLVVRNLTLHHEQARLEAQGLAQVPLVLDPGNLPVEKSGPARSLMVFAAMCAAGTGSWLFINRSAVKRRIFAKEPSP